MSDSDSEDYSSEEDADYEPSDEDYSEDDGSELVKENLEDEDEQLQKKKSGKKTGKTVSSRNKEAQYFECEDEREKEQDHVVDPEECAKVEKKKADDLWASFLSDVGQNTKPKSMIPASNKEKILVEEKLNKHQDLMKDTEELKSPGKITITKVFDFAGEEIKSNIPGHHRQNSPHYREHLYQRASASIKDPHHQHTLCSRCCHQERGIGATRLPLSLQEQWPPFHHHLNNKFNQGFILRTLAFYLFFKNSLCISQSVCLHSLSVHSSLFVYMYSLYFFCTISKW
ncbi:craniofacial development protein 1 isoform X2 [Narcine bancroftii]|uniref:craniofacial development protein 1 isoform X2 n=1 Tax=Narcine bancroftii TaxID=1343680 RepID=UPI00383149D4